VKVEGHLSSEELDRLIGAQSAVPGSESLSDLLERARAHLLLCKICRDLLSMHEAAERELERLRKGNPSESGHDCPERIELMELIVGMTSPERREQLVEHVISCDYCGHVFRQTTIDFSDETSLEEQSAISALETANPAFQKQLSRKLATRVEETLVQAKARPQSFPLWAYGTAAGILAVFVFGMILVRSRETSIDDLLAKAYSEQRPFELRFQNAPHAPFRIERGSGGRSRFERPSALLRAESVIAEKIREKPNDPSWLRAQAQSELLEGDYQAAIGSVEQAIAIDPTRVSLFADLGSAYFLRAEQERQPSDYGSAIEQFSKALAQAPNDLASLFNRALAEERLLLYDQAMRDWEHYLQLDPTGDWAEEARRHLETIQQEIRDQKKISSSVGPHLPESIPASTNEVGLLKTVDEHLEAYFKEIETTWLPVIYARDMRNTNGRSRLTTAIQLVGKIARSKHDDPWLYDLMRAPDSNVLGDAYEVLAHSLNSDDMGDYLTALRESRRAERLFRNAGSRAGELRAELEEVTALRLTDANMDCLRLARPLRHELEGLHYRWLESQLLIENAICFDLVGDEGEARGMAVHARDFAHDAGYATAHLRALTVLAGLEAAVGNTDASWKLAEEGLAIYWSGSYPRMRRYSLLDGMELLAEGSHETLLQVTILREAVTTIDADPDLMLRAAAHDQLAKCAIRADLPQLAEANFKEASALYEICPKNRVTASRRADEDIWLAEAEIRLKKYNSASKRLANIRAQILSSTYRYGLDRYYLVSGQLQTQMSDLSGAASSFGAAVDLAEVGLRSLKSERERMEWDRDHSEAYRNWVNVTLRQNDVRAAFAFWEWYKGAPLRSFRPNSHIATTTSPAAGGDQIEPTNFGRGDSPSRAFDLLSDAIKSMGVGSTLLSYAKLSDGYAVWVADERGVQSRWIPARSDELEREVRRFGKACSNPKSDSSLLRAQGRAIYELLINPVRDQLMQGQTLIIEGDEVIGELPVQALVDRQGHYLAETFDLVWSEGLYYQAKLRQSSQISRRSNLLAVAVPDDATTIHRERLPDVIGEVTSISRKFLSPRVLLGSEATIERVEREIPIATVFHFAGHGGSGPRGSGVILASSGGRGDESTVLTEARLSSVPMSRLQLAVLAACSTEIGKKRGIEDPDSLVRALLRAGVPHVIGTRWNLDSRSGAVFAEKLYDSLLLGKSPARALSEAARSIRVAPETSHPYYWAGFNVFGRA
jgi:CHAT domain-containing protein/tetratricopeptide (TPR) repeat protein